MSGGPDGPAGDARVVPRVRERPLRRIEANGLSIDTLCRARVCDS